LLCSETKEKLSLRRQRLQPLINRLRIASVEKGIRETNERMFRKHRVRQALDILEDADELFEGRMAVAFSGGKDSLVAVHLAMKTDPKMPIIYTNTTVEFPETLSYVSQLARDWKLDLNVAVPKTGFFRMVAEKGWASHEDRWCCRPCKEDPALSFMIKENIQAEITGTTRTESLYRRSLTPIRLPKKEPYLIRVNPIYDWNQQEVWAYIHQNKLPFNPLYDRGFRRIGCWCCPLNGPSHYVRLKKTHPKLYEFLLGFRPLHPSLVDTKAPTQTSMLPQLAHH